MGGDNIKINVRKIGWCDIDWIHLTLNRDLWWPLVNAVMKLGVPKSVREILEQLSNWWHVKDSAPWS